jgi:hypothetical protein
MEGGGHCGRQGRRRIMGACLFEERAHVVERLEGVGNARVVEAKPILLQIDMAGRKKVKTRNAPTTCWWEMGDGGGGGNEIIIYKNNNNNAESK